MEQEKTNLQIELFRKGISGKKLAEIIGAASDKTAWSKVNRKTGFYLTEAKKIRDELFPECTLEYLFAGYDDLVK